MSDEIKNPEETTNAVSPRKELSAEELNQVNGGIIPPVFKEMRDLLDEIGAAGAAAAVGGTNTSKGK